MSYRVLKSYSPVLHLGLHRVAKKRYRACSLGIAQKWAQVAPKPGCWHVRFWNIWFILAHGVLADDTRWWWGWNREASDVADCHGHRIALVKFQYRFLCTKLLVIYKLVTCVPNEWGIRCVSNDMEQFFFLSVLTESTSISVKTGLSLDRKYSISSRSAPFKMSKRAHE
jgi:hypothetical protein